MGVVLVMTIDVSLCWKKEKGVETMMGETALRNDLQNTWSDCSLSILRYPLLNRVYISKNVECSRNENDHDRLYERSKGTVGGGSMDFM